ncbi:Bifunctional epoxide hydrolase 2 [Dissophora globulifera]|uniref:Bifunctional epoxide hydrolase 2 n=1 Tax=Dissophora globulifera TaxID=979702 RepID=A0A9P6UPG9_9FUNG|nr:Bifunctional epoxide hydrolase 2 [Dissophora globulifera]
MSDTKKGAEEYPTMYRIMQSTIANIPAMEAHHRSISKPTAPEYRVSSFNHKFVTSRGYKFHLVDEGDPNGEPLILIHGFPDLWYGFRYQIRHFAKQGFRVLAIDNLGAGESDHPWCNEDNYDIYRVKNTATNFIGILDQLNISKAVFIGHDWGASVAWKIGLYFPERCRAVVSIGTPPQEPQRLFPHPDIIAEKFPQLPFMAEFQTREPETWFDGNAKTVAVALHNIMYASSVGTSAEEKQYYIDQYSRTSLHGSLNHFRATYLNWEDELPYVGQPYLIPSLMIVLESDPILTPAFVASYSTDSIKNLEQVVIKTGGHNVHSDNPEDLNRVLDTYLAKVLGKKRNEE